MPRHLEERLRYQTCNLLTKSGFEPVTATRVKFTEPNQSTNVWRRHNIGQIAWRFGANCRVRRENERRQESCGPAKSKE
jgi:hypothetical protein